MDEDRIGFLAHKMFSLTLVKSITTLVSNGEVQFGKTS